MKSAWKAKKAGRDGLATEALIALKPCLACSGVRWRPENARGPELVPVEAFMHGSRPRPGVALRRARKRRRLKAKPAVMLDPRPLPPPAPKPNGGEGDAK